MDLLDELVKWQKVREEVQAEDMQKEREEAERKEVARRQEQAKRRAELEASRPRSDESHPRFRPPSKTARRRPRPPSKTAHHRSRDSSASASPRRNRSRSPNSIARAKPQGENGGKPWTEEDDARLTELYQSRLFSKKKIADALKRSKSSVQNRINRIFNSDYQHDDEDEGKPGTIPPKGDFNYIDMAVVALYHLPENTGYLTQVCQIVERYSCFAQDLDMRRLDKCFDVPRYRAAMSTALRGAALSSWNKKDDRLERLNKKKGNQYYYKLTQHGIKIMETSKFHQFLAPLPKKEVDDQESSDDDDDDGGEEEEAEEEEAEEEEEERKEAMEVESG